MPTVALDWDDTLVDAKTQEWLPGAVHAVRVLLAAGYRVVIHTCRANWAEGLAAVKAKLADEQLTLGPTLWIHQHPGKPQADVYVDDRAVPFQGDWDAALTLVREHAPAKQPKQPVYKQVARTGSAQARGFGEFRTLR